MSTLAQIVCICGAITSSHAAQPFRDSELFEYRYEALASDTYLPRLSTPDLALDTVDWREARMRVFARRFADWTCRGRFDLADTAALDWPRERFSHAHQFVFRCR